VSTFAEVMQRKLWPVFPGHGVLTTVAILSGGHVPQVPQWHDATACELRALQNEKCKFFESTVELRSCLHHLLPPVSDSALLSSLRAPSKFPRICKRTEKYQPFVFYMLSASIRRWPGRY